MYEYVFHVAFEKWCSTQRYFHRLPLLLFRVFTFIVPAECSVSSMRDTRKIFERFIFLYCFVFSILFMNSFFKKLTSEHVVRDAGISHLFGGVFVIFNINNNNNNNEIIIYCHVGFHGTIYTFCMFCLCMFDLKSLIKCYPLRPSFQMFVPFWVNIQWENSKNSLILPVILPVASCYICLCKSLKI